MKPAYKVVMAIIMVVVLSAAITVAAFAAANTKEKSKGDTVVMFVKPEGENPYFIKTYADGSPTDEDFKIITFGDTHLNGQGSIGDAVALTLIENSIKFEKPDLVVIAGDVAVGPNAEQALRALGELFEFYNQYWGYALGNHDAEHNEGPSREDFVNITSEFEHCIISSAQGISGEGNCIVNVKNSSGEIIQSLVFIDSGSYLTLENCAEHGFEYQSGYDFIKYDQIEWYKSEMRDIELKNGKMPESIMFLHIPLKEYRIAYSEATKNGTVIYGAKRENECDSPYNTGMFEAILEVGSTKFVVCGHDHINDYSVEYEGVNLSYSLSASFNSYFLRKNALFVATYQLGGEAQFNDGYTLFSIKSNGKSVITPRYNQKNPSLFDGLTEEQRKVLFLDETLPK